MEDEGNFFSSLMVDSDEVKKKQKEQTAQMDERKKLYRKMNEGYMNLINEYNLIDIIIRYIPTLERNEILLKSRNTQKYCEFVTILRIDPEYHSKRLWIC